MYHLLYLFSLLSLSQSSVIVRWSQTDPLVLGAWRLLIAGLFFYIWSRREKVHRPPNGADNKRIIWAGFIFFLHLYSFAYASHHTSIAHVMLIYSINPVSTALGNRLFFNQAISPRQVVAYLLAALGIFILAREKTGGLVSVEGDFAAFFSAVTFSAYALLSQRARESLPNAVYTARLYLIGSVFFFVFAFLQPGLSLVPLHSQGLGGILLLTVFPTIIGHGGFILCLGRLNINFLSLGKLIEPCFSALSAYYLFGEEISKAVLPAFVLIAGAVMLIRPKPLKKDV